MKRALLVALTCGSLFGMGLVGCKEDRGGSAAGGGTSGGTAAAPGTSIATVNLDKIFEDLNYKTTLKNKLDLYLTQLKEDLKKYDTAYASQVQAYLKTLVPKDAKDGEKVQVQLTPQQQTELTNMVSGARQEVAGLAQQGDQLWAAYRAEWIAQYRKQLEPIVRKVAQDKKYTIVLVQADNIMFAESAVDITNAVVDAAKTAPPVYSELPMKHLEGRPEIPMNAQGPAGTQPSSTTQPATRPVSR